MIPFPFHQFYLAALEYRQDIRQLEQWIYINYYTYRLPRSSNEASIRMDT